jgi:hypothetical protein
MGVQAAEIVAYMTQEGSTASGGSEEYWRGKCEEAVETRKELVELVKHLTTQVQLLQQQEQQPKVPVAQPAPANAAAGRPINVSLGNILGVMPPLLMFLFGVYGTTTGNDIGFSMIIIGAIFAAVFLLYLMSRPRPFL